MEGDFNGFCLVSPYAGCHESEGGGGTITDGDDRDHRGRDQTVVRTGAVVPQTLGEHPIMRLPAQASLNGSKFGQNDVPGATGTFWCLETGHRGYIFTCVEKRKREQVSNKMHCIILVMKLIISLLLLLRITCEFLKDFLPNQTPC